jgi:UPF0716 family protein affecting phage T7 exclusion
MIEIGDKLGVTIIICVFIISTLIGFCYLIKKGTE